MTIRDSGLLFWATLNWAENPPIMLEKCERRAS